MAEILFKRVLYMEDDPGLARLLQKSLQRRGYEVETASDGEEGVRKAGTGAYDILLIDYNMPFLSGTDVIRKLSARPSPCPMIMLTGRGNEEVAVEALKLGARDYVVKDPEMKYLELLPVIIDRVMYQQHILREREQMERSVRDSEERYRTLVELSPDGIAVNSGGVFLFMNPAGARILGAPGPEALPGRAVLDIVHPDFHDLARQRMHQIVEERGTVPWLEEKFVRLDGTVIDVEVAGVALTYQGKPSIQMIFRDITERKKVEARLEQLALYDMLTGLPNRTLFFDRLNQLLHLAKRNQHILALLYVDLDHFKRINDQLGHEVGDAVLAEAGRRMQNCTRHADTVARMGGDEFIGICGRIAAPTDAAVVADKIIRVLSEPIQVKGHTCRIGASIGISLFPYDGDDVETLMSRADAAMYRVKESGKGGYAFSSDPR